MSALRQALTRYVRMRRGFGYSYQSEERCLGDFVAFMDATQATVITRALAMAWITQGQRTSWAWVVTQRLRARPTKENMQPIAQLSMLRPEGAKPGTLRLTCPQAAKVPLSIYGIKMSGEPHSNNRRMSNQPARSATRPRLIATSWRMKPSRNLFTIMSNTA